jgi:hypothetical protein
MKLHRRSADLIAAQVTRGWSQKKSKRVWKRHQRLVPAVDFAKVHWFPLCSLGVGVLTNIVTLIIS